MDQHKTKEKILIISNVENLKQKPAMMDTQLFVFNYITIIFANNFPFTFLNVFTKQEKHKVEVRYVKVK